MDITSVSPSETKVALVALTNCSVVPSVVVQKLLAVPLSDGTICSSVPEGAPEKVTVYRFWRQAPTSAGGVRETFTVCDCALVKNVNMQIKMTKVFVWIWFFILFGFWV